MKPENNIYYTIVTGTTKCMDLWCINYIIITNVYFCC